MLALKYLLARYLLEVVSQYRNGPGINTKDSLAGSSLYIIRIKFLILEITIKMFNLKQIRNYIFCIFYWTLNETSRKFVD